MRPPELAALGDIAEMLSRAGQALPHLRVPDPDLIQSISRERYPELFHPLSSHYSAMTQLQERPGRDGDARRTLDLFTRERPLSGTIDHFRATLATANALLEGCSGRYRRAEAGLASNAAPIGVLFPSACGADHQLRSIHRFVRSQSYTVYSAIVGLGLFLNCHPFEDGNGRIGRALFNHILIEAGASGAFPLHHFFQPTEGSFDLNLREAEMKQDWKPFVRYICRLLLLCSPSTQSASTFRVAGHDPDMSQL